MVMNSVDRLALRLLGLVDLTKLDSPPARALRLWLCRQPKTIQQLATHPDWHARWTALHGADRVLAPDMAWSLALHLATDPEAVVRKSAAQTLSILWARQPDRRKELDELILSAASPSALVEAILDACSDLWKRRPEHLDDALGLLTLAGRLPPRGALLTIGSVRIGVELERTHPEVAQILRDDWAASGSIHLRHHAAWAGGSHAMMSGDLTRLVDPTAPLPEGWKSTADVPLGAPVDSRITPHLAIREDALLAIRVAAMHGRALLLTGADADVRLQLGRSAAALLPDGTDDLVALPNQDDSVHPSVRRAAGGTTTVGFEHARARGARRAVRRTILWWLGSIACALTTVVTGIMAVTASAGITLPIVSTALFGLLYVFRRPITAIRAPVEPRLLISGSVTEEAPFVDGTQLSSVELFGDVRERAEDAAPHDRITSGAIHRAHRGVLYFDSPADLTPETQRALLAAVQSGRVTIRGHEIHSSVVESLPVTCDIQLVLGADTDPLDDLEPGFAAWLRQNADPVEIVNSLPDTPRSRRQLVQYMAAIVRSSDGAPHLARATVEYLCDEAAIRASVPGRLALEPDRLRMLIKQAGAQARHEASTFIEVEHVTEESTETAPR